MAFQQAWRQSLCTGAEIGIKEKLVELAAQNAALILSQDKERIRREEGRTIGAMKEIAALLGIGWAMESGGQPPV